MTFTTKAFLLSYSLYWQKASFFLQGPLGQCQLFPPFLYLFR